MKDIALPDYFYSKVISWQVKLPLIKSKNLLLSLAINDYDKKLKNLSEEQLRKLDSDNRKLCMSWIDSGIISKRARGLWG